MSVKCPYCGNRVSGEQMTWHHEPKRVVEKDVSQHWDPKRGYWTETKTGRTRQEADKIPWCGECDPEKHER